MIVNPWLFYVMDVCYYVKFFAGVMTFLTGVAFCFMVVVYFICMIDESEFDKKLKKNIENIAKRMIGLFVIFTLLYLFIPEKDTILLMQAAKLATTDNVNAIFEALKNAMNYAVSVLS